MADQKEPKTEGAPKEKKGGAKADKKGAPPAEKKPVDEEGRELQVHRPADKHRHRRQQERRHGHCRGQGAWDTQRRDHSAHGGNPEGPALLVANHSGLLPWDGLMLAQALESAHPAHPRARFLVADWLITLPFVQPFLARLGGVRACRENALRLLDAGHFTIAFPEGVKGAAKVFRERYRVKRFGRGGVVRVALDTGVPLVPVGIVGAEEAHPLLFKWATPARAAGLPFVPVTPTFPWLGPLGALPLPTKWVIRIGEPLALDAPASARRDRGRAARLAPDRGAARARAGPRRRRARGPGVGLGLRRVLREWAARQDPRPWLALALAAATVAVYADLRRHDFITYDDRAYHLPSLELS